MPSLGFEPTISAGELPQTYALDRPATGTGVIMCKKVTQSHYSAEVPRGFQEVKVPRLCDNGPEWW